MERLNGLTGVRVIRRELPEQTCPPYLPVAVDQRERDLTTDRLEYVVAALTRSLPAA